MPRALRTGSETGVADVDAYIAALPPKARTAMTALRHVIRKHAPDAVERLSYRLPTWFQDGVVVYVGAFTAHIGIFPPLRGDDALLKAVARYANPHGNLKFPLDKPMPVALMARIVKQRLKENATRRRR
ncbi:MAG: DUF1801 domain-containing protein [Gemmatimonadetes bacterium]|nr:DUF1801 domain-containing protein [Gemmatimonadota bacterium]